MASVGSAADVPREGDVIAGKYRVERVLGMGGMGVVVAARHVRLDERVALKFLLPNVSMNAEVVGRFEREARAASKIKNEHVARVTDVATLDNGSPYMVMEYLEGGDLSGWLAQHGPLPWELAVDFLLQASEAVGEAHTLGIVHRDLKPANLFCVSRPDGGLFIKVLDFGISKLTTPGSDSHMTRTTAFLGSPLYMSPEQLQASKGVDTRTDIWALGVILFELLTAKTPFDAESVTELAIKIATEAAPPVRTLRPDVPPALEQVVACCLEKDRARRFQSIGQLAMALADLAPATARSSVDRIVGTERRSGMVVTGGDGRASSLPAVAVPGLESAFGTASRATQPATASAWGQTGPAPAPVTLAPRRNGGVVAGAVVLLALAGGTFGLWVVKGRSVSAAASTGAPLASTATDPSAPSAAASQAASPAAPSTGSATETAPEQAPIASAPSAMRPSPPSPDLPRAQARVAGPVHQPVSGVVPARPAVPSVEPSKASSRADCNPPYTLGAKGEHRYKPECI